MARKACIMGIPESKQSHQRAYGPVSLSQEHNPYNPYNPSFPEAVKSDVGLTEGFMSGFYYSIQSVAMAPDYDNRLEQHTKIYDAIEEKKYADEAEQAMREHSILAWKYIPDLNCIARKPK